MEFGKYQFLSWSRRGIARSIIEKDTLGKSGGTAVERARIPVAVKINSTPAHTKEFDLIGPADITGIQQKMIVRSEPLNGIPDYEPNLLPYVEFYDEDFPWRYTPASATGSANAHLRPWLALIVLKENEFLDTERREPLPSIKIGTADYLPPVDQLHLWAHMHSNLPHEEGGSFNDFLEDLEADAKLDPDGVYSRLMCPRKLEAKALYHAFLVPSYETGRLAGLGRPTAGIKAQQHSFAADLEFPVYYRWYFRTGQNFDFEYLVKLLKPRAMDERVGVRPMDCSKPAFVQADKKEEVTAPNPPIMLLEGAMKAPQAKSTVFPPANTPQPFFDQIQKLINLNKLQEENLNEDPFVTVPYYGMNHAVRKDNSSPGKKVVPEFDPNSLHWYNDLNRDPRTRVPAGFGMRVIQQNQEKFMDIAWKQLGEVLEANKKMLLAQFTVRIMAKMFQKNVVNRPSENLLGFAQPMFTRVLDGAKTLKFSIQDSILPEAVFAPSFKRITRNNTSLARGLKINDAVKLNATVVKGMNKTKGISPDVIPDFKTHAFMSKLKMIVPRAGFSNLKVWSLKSNLDPAYVYNLPVFKGGLPAVNKWDKPIVLNQVVSRPSSPTIGPVGPRIPAHPSAPTPPIGSIDPSILHSVQPSFSLSNTVRANNKLSAVVHTKEITKAYSDASFRMGYRDQVTTETILKVDDLKTKITEAMKPSNAYKKLLDSKILWPSGTFKEPKEEFVPAMAYPDIPEPAYKHLVDIDEEFLLPNLKLIPPNTLSLLRTNQKFIEAYLMGLNYEMGKELLWREYPTDMRGSYFRQFWDVSGFVTPDTTPKDADALKDIEPIHLWPNTSNLGKHNKRDKEGDAEQLVFVIKGDLLKKFPNTVIYAQKAIKVEDKNRILTDMSDEAVYKKHVRFPLYQAEIRPDIKLLGFDLTIEEASGQDNTPGFTDKLGWFFIIAEVPGEPHFGMDITYNPNEPGIPGDPDNPAKFTWNDLSWENFNQDIPFVKSDVVPKNTGKPGGKFTPPNDPKTGVWGKSSADMASILFQRPVMVAIHSSEMLDVKVRVITAGIKEMLNLKEYSKIKFSIS